MTTKLLSKLSKTLPDHVEGRIMYLEPSKKTCPHSSAGCRASCLVHGGRLRMDNASQARRTRTAMYEERHSLINFDAKLNTELRQLVKSTNKSGKIPAVRLNGLSDCDFHAYQWTYKNIGWAQGIQFWDYTKDWSRRSADCHLTYSATEHHTKFQIWYKVMIQGHNVAVVFDELPARYAGCKVIDGDVSDWRVDDPSRVIVGLKAKGKAKKDTTGFVRRVR